MENEVWRFLRKPKTKLPYDPAIPLPGIYPKKTKILIQKDTCTAMFTAALLTTAQTRKRPVSSDEWVNTQQIHNTVLCPKIRMLLLMTTWMDLEDIM